MPQKKRSSQENNAIIIGIDLSAKENRKTPVCLLKNNQTPIFFSPKTDDEIIFLIDQNTSPSKYRKIIVIDAPLTWKGERYREKDREAMKHGARLLPITTPGMIMLYKRAVKLMRKIGNIRETKLEVYETHPYSIARILGYKNTVDLAKDLLHKDLAKDESDALACCIAGLLLLEDYIIKIGEKPYLILPRKGTKNDLHLPL